jgi:hypothetical protein
MTIFGAIWSQMLESGEAPRESMFSENHSEEWYKARAECRRRAWLLRGKIKGRIK